MAEMSEILYSHQKNNREKQESIYFDEGYIIDISS